MLENYNKIRVRFAPSPTGYMHVGGLRTALYNYLFAKQNGGTFVLRIEDTDRKRFVEGAVESLIRSLKWAGLNWNEGVFTSAAIKDDKTSVYASSSYKDVFEVGEYGQYIQSERLEVYKKYAEQLVSEGKAYHCFCTSERLEEMRSLQNANKQAPKYDKHCLKLSKEEISENLKNNIPYVIRLNVKPNEEIEFEDIVRGKVKFNTKDIDDQVLLKSDGFPTYHLAVVVDDNAMKISHVLRAEEWLPSTPKHILLYKAFGWNVPEFAHLPQLLSVDKKKLSKRMGDVAVEDYIKKGYLKEALINFVALLGWNPGQGSTQEIFTMEELVEKFDLGKVHKAGAVFDLKKLDWINNQYIKNLPVDNLCELALPFLEKKGFFARAGEGKYSKEYVKKVLTIERDRLVNLSEVGENNKFFFEELEYDAILLKWKNMEKDAIIVSLSQSQKVLENITEEKWELKNIEEKLLEAAGENRGELLWPLRVALTGAQKSPSPFEVAWVLGKYLSLARIKKAIEKL